MQAFGDGFDLYAAVGDALVGYWDSGGVGNCQLQTGRFSGSRCMRWLTNSGSFVKSSGQNDTVHHIVCAIYANDALSGTSAMIYFTLSDGATAQCSIVFRSDGAVLLTSGGPTGTTLATYTGALTSGAWVAFEFEVVINNTTGSFTVRKNGNTSNDFMATSLNTRGGTSNNYASRVTVGSQVGPSSWWQIDDFLWRSDPTAVPWVGDIRCYVRMPASDVQAQFSRGPAVFALTPTAQTSTTPVSNTVAKYTFFTATYDGAISSLTVSMSVGYTGNMKCTLFASQTGGTGVSFLPTTILGSATPISNPATGNNTFTFSTPVAVTKGVQYWVGFMSDTSSGTWNIGTSNSGAQLTGTTYAAFPTATGASAANAVICTLNITVGSNTTLVNEPQEDGGTSYVYDSNVGDADFYAVGTISATPANIVCVTTRGYYEKSDAGTRAAAVQLKSGSTTVTSTPTALGTSWGWLWRTDLNDPNTSAPWTATGVSNATIGPIVTA